jgi:hypothetical protein
MTNFTIEGDVVEWFDGGEHVFDLCGLTDSDAAALEKLHLIYEESDSTTRAKIRGSLWLLEDGLTCQYIQETDVCLSRILEHFSKR